ncbi:Lon protease family protein [Erwinia sp. INIA-01]|uniref:Lon protease family protein n=1 Tax=Erwinia sp. INIA01 TaxID=2991500 RepID=UPI002224B08C|nr:Lon protease family protein [Erwinia sp. INIA01]MCW1874612.1 Lon protease family protein [Erwinia sp. INIA01]
MTNNRLEWRALQPDTERFQHLISQAATTETECFANVQSRLFNGLSLLLQTPAKVPLMLVKSAESAEYLALLQDVLSSLVESDEEDDANLLYGGHYLVEPQKVIWRPAESSDDNFASTGGVHQADWIEAEQLFGCVRVYNSILTLSPGLVHRANGGVLILSLRALLAQPLLWLRLKKIIVNQRFDWYSQDETRPLPLDVPSMPMQLRLVLTGDRDALADFQDMEPELASLSLYSEFEENIQLVDEEEFTNWMQWVLNIAQSLGYPAPAADFWPVLIREAARYTGDQETLPLDPTWLARQLQDAALYSEDENVNGENLRDALTTREWREGFLSERVRDDILLDQILIETEGEMVGQINALSVIDFPGHPRPFGEPSRISCVVHVGDGEFTDVERKAELGGNIHAKGMMIMQAWLIAELELDQQLPFSASLVFEQSYSEVDGDSASLAELCVLISALALQPINQQIAVTGSVDQFGRVQPVGGLNEKIEGFFNICNQRTLNGNQGVIIPAANVRHLSLQQEVVDAVREGKFHLWAVSSVDEALPLLTGVEWDKENDPCLLRSIQDRIAQINQQDARQLPWALRWLNWFNQR